MKENVRYMREEGYKIGRLNYKKADFEGMKQYFANTDWKEFDIASTVDKKWDFFLKIHDSCIKRYVPRMSKREIGRSDWFNRECMDAKNKRDRMWRNWRRRKRQDLWVKYTEARNEYVRLYRETKRKYEKDIVNKCKDQSKLFYRFVNSKLRNKEGGKQTGSGWNKVY